MASGVASFGRLLKSLTTTRGRLAGEVRMIFGPLTSSLESFEEILTSLFCGATHHSRISVALSSRYQWTRVMRGLALLPQSPSSCGSFSPTRTRNSGRLGADEVEKRGRESFNGRAAALPGYWRPC